ncbi:MAG TPA: YhjD/YihY/BrkB family envelope integrity protein [Streptosporangiaceae bacterium]
MSQRVRARTHRRPGRDLARAAHDEGPPGPCIRSSASGASTASNPARSPRPTTAKSTNDTRSRPRWTASGYVAVFMRASNAIYDVDEGRPIWKTAPVRLVTTVALVVMLVIAAAIVVLTGPIANQVGTAFGSTRQDLRSARHRDRARAAANPCRPARQAIAPGRQPLPVSPPDEREGARSAATGDKDDNERHNR